MTTFELRGTAREIPIPQDLSNTERAMLRELAEPGAPLWKILRSMLDYGDGLSKALVTVDLLNPEQVNAARKVQATIIAVAWVNEVFQQALTDVEPPTEKQADV